MQKDLDTYLHHYNRERTHQGRNMNGRVPYPVFIDGLPKSKKRTKNQPRKLLNPSSRQGL